VKTDIISINEISVRERTRKDYGNVEELSRSIREEGLIQSLTVQTTSDQERPYRLLAGERRLKACERAGLTKVPVRIYDRELSDLEIESIELAENLYRKDFTYVEDCAIKRKIYELELKIHGKRVGKTGKTGTTQKEVAEKLGKSSSQFHDDVELAKAIEFFPDLGECKSKSDAVRLYKSMKEDVIRAEMAKRVEKEAPPSDAIYKKLCDSYIVGDFFELCRKIPSGSMHLCEVDPPYAISLHHQKKGSGTHIRSYNEVKSHEYKDFIRKTLRECYRIMADHSWLILWFAQEPWFEMIYQLAVGEGFEGLRMPGIWAKQAGQSQQTAFYLANCTEMFFYFRKGKPAIINQGRSNLFSYSPFPPSKKTHSTERPIEMMYDILTTFCSEGARILVPFAGSGNTLLAAANARLSGIGYDLERSYRDSYIIKVYKIQPGEHYTSYKKG